MDLDLTMLRDPVDGGVLTIITDKFGQALMSDSSRRYPVERGIVRFLCGEALEGNNAKYQKLYDRLAPLYGMITSAYALLREGGEKKRVMQYLSALTVRDGDSVLEVSAGNGRNFKYLNPKARYYGLDISFNMLKRCRSMMAHRGRRVTLIEAQAENLPLMDDSFDVVYSAGGFNFFTNRKKAVQEMLRVAKPGTLLMISDETEKVRSRYESSQYYKDQTIRSPADFIPKECTDVEYREVCKGELYALTFCKPTSR